MENNSLDLNSWFGNDDDTEFASDIFVEHEIAVLMAEGELRSAQKKYDELKNQLEDVIKNAAATLSHARKVEFARVLYWAREDTVPVEYIAKHVLNIPEEHVPDVVGPFTTDYKCPICNRRLEVKNRFELKFFNDRCAKDFTVSMCGICRTGAFIRHVNTLYPKREASNPPEVVQKLNRMPYKEYLQSDHWQTLRKKKKDAVGSRCELCFSEDHLEVHHKTYERRGDEELNDLIVLCHSCHAKHHDVLPKAPTESLPQTEK